jgi:type IV pilus assembly protein PilQ
VVKQAARKDFPPEFRALRLARSRCAPRIFNAWREIGWCNVLGTVGWIVCWILSWILSWIVSGGSTLAQFPDLQSLDLNQASREALGVLQQLPPGSTVKRNASQFPLGQESGNPGMASTNPNAMTPNAMTIPLAEAPQVGGQVRLQLQNNLVHLTSRGATVAEVMALISEQMNLNVVTAEDLTQRVNVTLNGVLLEDALNAILSVNGLIWARHNNIVTISMANPERKLAPNVQGKAIQVFNLNYALGEDLNQVIVGLLSPIGKSYVIKISNDEQRAAREQLIVEDLPPYIERIAHYISQADIAPRQVVVEAHILQVTLKDSNKHGVNFNQLARISNSRVNIRTIGFATETAPVAAIQIQGSDLEGWLECLKSTNDTKTLASPRVAVLNGQEAKITVGGKLGYLMTTSTQTAALQSVSFLDFGVIMTVLPIITEDRRILLKVSPTVSTARINPTSKLPDSESTEVSTNVMLRDGQAIVIGGLIKEEKNDSQSKIPYLGDIPLLGRLFRASSLTKERNEIIIALLPRIVQPGDCECWEADQHVVQASTPLMDRNLNLVDRSSWEGVIPGAAETKKRWWPWGSRRQSASTPLPPPYPESLAMPMRDPSLMMPQQPLPPIGFSTQLDPTGVPVSAAPAYDLPGAFPAQPSPSDAPNVPPYIAPTEWSDR